MRRFIGVAAALAAVIALPVLLKPENSVVTERFPAADRLVIITPHVESIRHEFESGFRRWMKERYGREVVIDWRVPGGTSEIARVIDSGYRAAFEHWWRTTRGEPWREEFAKTWLLRDDPGPARAAWLASGVGIGIDLLFGGGTLDFIRMKDKGYLVPGSAAEGTGIAAVAAQHPDWFTDGVLPETWGGEQLRDPDHCWVGCVLSSFGICYNRDFLARRGIASPPSQWADLALPVYENQVALADPAKSATVVKMFENILQQEIQAAVREGRGGDRDRAVEAGWRNGLSLVQRIGANARYWTDSATKVPLDVAGGDAAVGMCIDFYARSFMEELEQVHGSSRMGFAIPAGGTSFSADAIGMLRGAPNPELATRFVEFTLTMEGQRLWAWKAGTPGGPERTALRRIAIRRDFFTTEDPGRASDPEVNPWQQQDLLVYDPSYTGRSFEAIRLVIRAMCIDTHQELKAAWRELIAHGFPPEATAAFSEPGTATYRNVTGTLTDQLRARDMLVAASLSRSLAAEFRERYRRAAELARAGR